MDCLADTRIWHTSQGDIPEEAHANFVCTTWLPGDPAVAQTILGPGYQVACHPGESDKCLAVRKAFGALAGCEEDFCLEGLDGGEIEVCGSGSRVARGTVERPDGSTLTVAHVHGSSGVEAAGAGWAVLPDTVARKAPKAGRQWIWQWAFPSTRVARLREPPRVARFPVHASTLQRALRRAGIAMRVHPHALRHSFATHLLENGVDIRTLQQLMGHTDVRTTMQYLHVARDALDRVVSPLDGLEWP